LPNLLSPDAVWIGPAHPFDLHEAYLNFRRRFTLDSTARVELTITADSRYKLWVNGQFVARGPERCFPHHQSVDLLDLTSFVRRGDNILAAQVYSPGYSHFSYLHRSAVGLVAELRSSGQTILVTDPAWRVQRDVSFAPLVPRISIYGSGVEVRDLAHAADWQALDYDDAQWDTARIAAAQNAYLWTNLVPRALPLLIERATPLHLLETRSGEHQNHSDPHLALRLGWMHAAPASLAPDAAGWFAPRLEQGQTAFWLYDLGRDYTMQGWAEIENALGGELLAVSYQEKIRDGELVISDPATYCRVRMTDTFTLRAGNQSAETFALRGGRYLLFQLSGPAGDALRIRFRARVSEYPLEISTPFQSGDQDLNRIASMCETTLHACLQDGFIDCTWRESAQWVGDALPQALIMTALGNDNRPLRRVVELATQNAYPDGVLPSVLPGEVHAYTVLDYNWIWIELLALDWRLNREAAFVHAMWAALVKLLDRFHQDLGADGLLASQKGRRVFLDWSPQSRLEPNAVYNLQYLLGLRTAITLAREMGSSENAATWESRAEVFRQAARAAFWHEGRWYDDLPRTTFSQLAAALALLSGAVQPDETNALLDAICARSLDPEDGPAPGRMVLASPFRHHWLFEALRQFGRTAAVVEIVKRRWGRWTDLGYPTTWENWNVDFPDGSQCHAFSAHPRYHLAEILRAP
jgi:hypothetical protein